MTEGSRRILRSQLEGDEGFRLFPYYDTVNKLTVGIGHNLTDRGLSVRIVGLIFEEDVDAVEHELDRALPWWRGLDEVRQRILANMAFNLGATKLLAFRRMLDALKDARYDDAADEMLDSTWAWQVGQRAVRLAKSMRSGKD